MSSKVKKRLAAVAAVLVAGGVLAYIAFGGIEKNLVYFWTPHELLAKGAQAYGATIRLGGVVIPGTYKWNPKTLDLRFKVGESPKPGGPTVAVEATGAPPQMFREGIGVVVEGTYDGTLFHGNRVIVKHSNQYRPPKPGENPAELYKTLVTKD